MTTDLSTSGTVITFYSYKGGTGRSMALANAACLLAKESTLKSQKVLVIDWDLEAPGLHRFFLKTEEPQHRDKPGIINYFERLQELLKGDPTLRDQIAAEQGWTALSTALPIEDYIILDVASGVDLIPAGRFDSKYPALVRSFNWVEFYTEFGSAIKAFRELLESKYSYCLIDSRTGLTDISGICTMLLPEKLVTVFTPNRQSQSGVVNVIRQAIDYRRASDDFRPLVIFPLPSRIDLAEIELRETWRQNYQKAFENCFRQAYEIEECDLTAYFDEVQLPHVSYYAYGESISVLREERSEAFSLSRAYRVFTERLVNLTRSWETAGLVESSSVQSGAVHQLRAPIGDFVGRQQEVDTLINTLRHGSRACITGISGMGGVGKTELALLVAERIAGDYPDAQFFINLQGTDANPRPPQEVLATCIRAFLGSDARLPEDLDQLTQLYLSQLRGKRVLLLLDNAADSAQVRPLLPPPGSALLVTSRQAVALPGMTSLTLNPLTEEDARKLLLEITPRAEPAADEICKLCGYLPLAIRAAGSLLAITADLDPVDYAAQLKDERNRLERIGSEGVEIRLEASFNLGYARLPPETARVFRLLSVFPATFDAMAEEVICADAEHAQLSDLVRRSLVLYDSNTKRYRLHDLSRLFANAKLESTEKQLTERRHAEHFLTKAEAIEPHLGETGLGERMEWFKAEQDNMRTALAWSLENDTEMALRFAYTLSGFWNILGQLTEERTALNHSLEKTADASTELRMRVLGRAAARQSDSESAKALAEVHLTLSRETGNRLEEAWALQNLGRNELSQGNLAEGRSLLEKALTLFRQVEDKGGIAMTLLNLGILAVDQDDLVSAQTFVRESLELNEELGNRGDLAVARMYLAFLLHKRGEREPADELISESLDMLQKDARQVWLPWGLHWKARIAIERREFETARSALRESLTIFQNNQDTGGKIRSLLACSWLNAAQGLWETAATLLAAEESQRKQQNSPPVRDWKQEIEFIKSNSRASLGDSQFAAAFAAGERMSLEQAVAYAIEKL
jgi:MinD-like ATPase involved in chromosome partitioning or flagellar assembly/tetratricopeptide (TPR) repeat protein